MDTDTEMDTDLVTDMDTNMDIDMDTDKDTEIAIYFVHVRVYVQSCVHVHV
jgi:hypothetical protein